MQSSDVTTLTAEIYATCKLFQYDCEIGYASAMSTAREIAEENDFEGSLSHKRIANKKKCLRVVR